MPSSAGSRQPGGNQRDHNGQYYIGLMSGTSTDGVDGVLACLAGSRMQVLAACATPLSAGLRTELLALNTPGPNELWRAAQAANALADCYAANVHALLATAGIPASQVRAIGAHGQTVRHAPRSGVTLQLNSPARLAELTGIAVVADFRSRDVAAGGQGAPLVPAFHAACFGRHEGRAILNLGGIANLTVLGDHLHGFDTGPANMLMDAWAQKCLGAPYDDGGAWAAGGQVNKALLDAMLAEPWFASQPPRSTGRDLFNLGWLEQKLAGLPAGRHPDPADTQASLMALSVRSIVEAIHNFAPQTSEVVACGGGTRNKAFMQALGQALPCRLTSSESYGIPAQNVEALAFAWLAQAHLLGIPACLPAVTGARHASIAGCLYPA